MWLLPMSAQTPLAAACADRVQRKHRLHAQLHTMVSHAQLHNMFNMHTRSAAAAVLHAAACTWSYVCSRSMRRWVYVTCLHMQSAELSEH